MYHNVKPVILRKQASREEEISKGNFVVETKQAINKQVKTDLNMRKIEEDENYKPAVVTHSLAIEIAKARTAKGLTQKELAAKICEQPSVIQSYERTSDDGVAVESRILMKINKVLGTNFKKPPRPKAMKD